MKRREGGDDCTKVKEKFSRREEEQEWEYEKGRTREIKRNFPQHNNPPLVIISECLREKMSPQLPKRFFSLLSGKKVSFETHPTGAAECSSSIEHYS